MMNPLFQSAQYQEIFAQHQLDSFDQIWAKEIDWFEEPNQRRGGWSGVGRLELQTSEGRTLSVFVKKQQNHGRRSLCHPVNGEPTFRREFKRLTFLHKHQIAAPKVVFYAEQQQEGDARAILITEELSGYMASDLVISQYFLERVDRLQKLQLLKQVAIALREFHETGLVHRSLYPKHIFIKRIQSGHAVALIDLEKARFRPFSLYRAYFDLSALNRHAEYWSRSQRLYFLKQYFQVEKVNWYLKILCQLIVKRASR